MKTLNLVQGTPDWHAHRAQHFNASDVPAMMGCSPYKTRSQLLREIATGITPEVDAATQRRFDDGHRFEELARPLAEEIIGEELYPCTGVLEDTKYSASFDGLTLLEDTAFEHKTLNDDLRRVLVEGADGSDLPLHYQVQMEQQAMVSRAERILFMATTWDRDDNLLDKKHCWYTPNPELRAKIVAGWEQFEQDVAAYVPEAAPAAVVATPVEGFGALTLRVEGRVLASSLDQFRADADAFLARLPKASELETDQDFSDAESAVKACAEAEARIKTAKDAALAQMADVETVLRTADTIAESIRAARLALDKVVKAEKENRRAAIVSAGVKSVLDHYTSINATLGEYSIGAPASLSSELGAAIKGKRTLSSMQDAVDTAVATAKIEASQRADKVRASIVVLDERQDAMHLLPDRVALAHSLTPDVLRSVIRDRLDDARAKEAARIDAERAQEAEARSHGALGNDQPAAPAKTDADPATAGIAHDAQTGDAEPTPSGFAWSPETHTQPTANNICIAVAEYYGVSTKTAWQWCVDAFAKCERVAA